MKIPPARALLRWALWGATGLGFVVAICNGWILWRTRGRTFHSAAAVPVRGVGLVLGTSPVARGGPNPFFEGRMDAAARLYKTGKVRHLLLSGDNRHRGYDEPTSMKQALAARGVPGNAMHLDYAGFRTLDSMARAHQVFGLHEVTVITDDFHLPRSIFLADAFGIKAIGFPSAHVPAGRAAKTLVREVFSRVAAVLDVYVLHRQPKFYGRKIDVAADPSGL
jgi:SanA protein